MTFVQVEATAPRHWRSLRGSAGHDGLCPSRAGAMIVARRPPSSLSGSSVPSTWQRSDPWRCHSEAVYAQGRHPADPHAACRWPLGRAKPLPEDDAGLPRRRTVCGVRRDPEAAVPLADVPLAQPLTGFDGDDQRSVHEQQHVLCASSTLDPLERVREPDRAARVADRPVALERDDAAAVGGPLLAALAAREVDAEEPHRHGAPVTRLSSPTTSVNSAAIRPGRSRLKRFASSR